MKTLILILFVIALASCQKEQVCVSCIEKNSNYNPGDFCGTPLEAEIYKGEMERYNGSIFHWDCVYN